MRQTLILAALVSVSFLTAASNSLGRTWEVGVEGNLGGMPYRYYLPAGYDSSIQYPLLLFLHGGGEVGTNNINQVREHIGGMIDRTESEYPAILVAPQLPPGTPWSPFEPRDHTNELLAQLVSTFSVDTDRLYLTGGSRGGFGSMEYVQRFNGEMLGDLRFAAVAPLSGSFIDTSREGVPENLQETPIWLIHGRRDFVVGANSSRITFRALAGLESSDPIPFTENLFGGPTAIAGNTRYSEVTGGGHSNVWAPVYNNPLFYDWMFAQSRAIPEPSTLVLAVILGLPYMFGASLRTPWRKDPSSGPFPGTLPRDSSPRVRQRSSG